MTYKAFDKFLALETWHTRHGFDEERFFAALHEALKDKAFDAEKMGEYFREKTRTANAGKEPPYEQAIAHYVAAAWAVKGYLKAAGST